MVGAEVLRTLERPRERPREGDATLGGMADAKKGALKIEAGKIHFQMHSEQAEIETKTKIIGGTSRFQTQVVRVVTWLMQNNFTQHTKPTPQQMSFGPATQNKNM